MKKELLILSFCFMLIFCTLTIFAEEQKIRPVAIGKCVNLIQTCSDCTYVNLTSIIYPDSTFAFRGEESMTQNSNIFNYTFCNTTALGKWSYTTHGDVGGDDTSGSVTFLVNKNGVEFEVKDSIIYLIILIGVVLAFGLCLYFNITIPWKNYRNDAGMIVNTNDLKYLKLFLLPITYALFTWLLNILIGISSLLSLDFPSSLFEVLFLILTRIAWPMFVLWIIMCVVIYVRDSKIKDKLAKGLDPMK